MPIQGRSAFDDPALMTRGLGGDTELHSGLKVDGNLTVTGTIAGGTVVDLANNVYLQSANAAGTGFLDLLKADASDNTVINAKTGKVINLDVNGSAILSLSATALQFTPALFLISANTSDAADSKGLVLTGGGAAGTTRGANILVYGNEAAGAGGYLQLESGNVANSVIYNYLSAATSTWGILNASAAVMVSMGVNGELTFDGTNGGGITISKVGKTLTLKTGSNAKAGTFTANGSTPVTVSTTAFIAGSTVAISLKTVGGTVGAIPHLATATAGTGFTVVGTAADTSVYNWAIIDSA